LVKWNSFWFDLEHGYVAGRVSGSFNYIPYRMDSELEINTLKDLLKEEELKDLEVYYNGYKNQDLQNFWINTFHGRYTPDFLILKRKGKKMGISDIISEHIKNG
jgi:hypothetical protein